MNLLRGKGGLPKHTIADSWTYGKLSNLQNHFLQLGWRPSFVVRHDAGEIRSGSPRGAYIGGLGSYPW